MSAARMHKPNSKLLYAPREQGLNRPGDTVLHPLPELEKGVTLHPVSGLKREPPLSITSTCK